MQAFSVTTAVLGHNIMDTRTLPLAKIKLLFLKGTFEQTQILKHEHRGGSIGIGPRIPNLDKDGPERSVSPFHHFTRWQLPVYAV